MHVLHRAVYARERAEPAHRGDRRGSAAIGRGGVKEVTLLGQIVTSYGRKGIRKKNGNRAFVQFLEAVHEVQGLERIRFTAPHPKGFGDDLVRAYADLPKLCELRASARSRAVRIAS